MSLVAFAPIMPPRALQSLARSALHDLLAVEGRPPVDFSQPKDEAALVPPQSISWQVFKNPVALFTGGVAAVILELAEPRVRAGVWDFTSFRDDPVTRLRRTGLAAMITVYGARTTAESMIAGVRRMHQRVAGTTDKGEAYRADDPQLLNWVQATAAFGFLQAYHRYVRPLSRDARDRYYGEGTEAAALYGADDAPRSEAELRAFFLAMEPRLERSDVIFEFLKIMREAPVFPQRLRPAQRMLVRAAVDLVPPAIRHKLRLDREGLRFGEHALVKLAGNLADRIVLEASPAVQACKRLGLPADYLYRRARS
jgi:uncharacterized protein (DUF2236 family)